MSKARDSIEDLKTIDANLAAKAPLASPVFTGNVGIGTASPSSKLTSESSAATNIVAKSTNGNGGYMNFQGLASNGTQTFGVNHNGTIFTTSGLAVGGTGAANTLDDYEEGTFIPTLRGSSNAGSFSADSAHIGSYTKIGDVCTLNFVIGGTLSGATGSYTHFNLPFTVKAGTSATGRFSYVYTPNLSHVDFSSYVIAGQTLGYFIIKTASATSPVYPAPSSFMSGSVQIYGTVTYQVA